MVTPAEPQDNYEPTDDELTRALGWEAADDDEPAGDAPATEPQPAAQTTEPTPAEPAAPTAEPQTFTEAVQQPTPQPDPFRQAQEAELQQLRQQQAVTQINQQAQSYYNQLLSQGWDQEQAYQAAQQRAQNLYSNHQLEETRRIANEQAKTSLAHQLVQETGAPLNMLLGYNDPGSMRNAAQMYKATQGEVKQLRDQLNQVNKAPVQSFDSNRMTASNSVEALNLKYATDPNFEPTPEQFARMGLG